VLEYLSSFRKRYFLLLCLIRSCRPSICLAATTLNKTNLQKQKKSVSGARVVFAGQKTQHVLILLPFRALDNSIKLINSLKKFWEKDDNII